MKLEDREFAKISWGVYNYCGINLHYGKKALVRARVMKRIRKLQLNDFSQYLEYLEQDSKGDEFLAMVDVLTTNKTSFFREVQHFDFIRNNVIPSLRGRKVEWWSAGCSTGQEPVSCAITLLEQQVSEGSVRILATDLSREVIKVAKKGLYPAVTLSGVSDELKQKYFKETEEGIYKTNPRIHNLITYGRLNLKKSWPMRGPFHLIMCRNVMIYFNRKTQRQIVSRLYDMLEPDGYLFLGNSESMASLQGLFKSIRPAVYQKI